MKIFGLVVLVIVVVAAFSVVAWQGGWWLREESVNRSAEIREDSFARQTALLGEVIDLNRDVANIDVQLLSATTEQAPVLRAQRKAIVNQMCDSSIRLNDRTNIPNGVQNTLRVEC